jgi:L-alanine-DL-glutamate epimerase-like enolase superfamily enzyme
MPARTEVRKSLGVSVERWPIEGGFTIARGSKHEALVVVATISEGGHSGRGECVPCARYGESVESVVHAIEGCANPLAQGLGREELRALFPPGAARNALDCALWDLEAKVSGKGAAELAGLAPLHAVETAFTISLGSPQAMAARAKEAAHYPLLKLKLGGDADEERLASLREAVPRTRLIADANEAWRPQDLERLLAAAQAAGVELVEQPLPAGEDDMLQRIVRAVPVCADESVHDRASLEAIASRYDAVNIKLDKTGGLTEALATAEEARKLGLKIMVGCMVATSLAMAPALLVAQGADWIDLDGPLLLARDRNPSLTYAWGKVLPPPRALWG